MSGSSCVVFHSCIDWLPQTQTWIYNQIDNLPKDIENHILCERVINFTQFQHPNVHSLCRESRLQCVMAKLYRRVKWQRVNGYFQRQLELYNGQILHSHFGNKGWEDCLLAQHSGLKQVVTFYGVDVNHLPLREPEWRKRYRALFANVALVLCEGPFMAQSIVALGCPKEKVVVHHLGVNLEKIFYKPVVWRQGEPLKVLIAASFREKKGIPYALAALGCMQTKVGLEITIIGDATNSPTSQAEKQEILQVIEEYELQSKVSFMGFQPYNVLIEQMYKNHVFCSPSVTAVDGDSEGGAPVTIIEAAAAGILIVSTKHCDIPEVVLHERSGLLAEERDVEGLVGHFEWLIHHTDCWLDMLQTGRQHIEREFDASVQGERLATLYHSL